MARRRFRRRRRGPVQRGWNYDNDGINFSFGTTFFASSVLMAGTQLMETNAAGVIDNPKADWFCQRLMGSMFPRLFRFDQSDTNPVRLWTWALHTVDRTEFAEFEDLATTQNAVDQYDDVNAWNQGNGRVLQQGIAPVYFTAIFPFFGLGGDLVTASGGITSTGVGGEPWGPARVDFDFKGPFGLREEQDLRLTIAPAGSDLNFETGDSVDVEFYTKGLWQKRR